MPFNALELKEEIKDVDGVNEVDESITNIALRLKVHGKVEVVILTFVVQVDHFKQLHLLELIRDVPNHYCCSFFVFSHDSIEINVIT